MWSVLLNPTLQEVGLFAAFLAFASAFYAPSEWLDRDPRTPRYRPFRDFWPEFYALPRRRSPHRRPEASVEIWTNAQGETCGRVRRGPCRGMRLEEMSREECEAQAAYCREHDPSAAAALEGFMRQRFAQRRRADPPRAEGAMTRTSALAELGLEEGASQADIHSAYRKLIMKHHPDHGGSHAKAARLNQARDLLLD